MHFRKQLSEPDSLRQCGLYDGKYDGESGSVPERILKVVGNRTSGSHYFIALPGH